LYDVFLLFTEVSFQQTCECSAVSCFVTENLKNAVKTGIFNRLAQNQHKSIKIYAVDFSSLKIQKYFYEWKNQCLV